MSPALKKYIAEFVGTAVLVVIGCGAVAIGGYGTGAAPNAAGAVAISFAFGIAVMAMAYGIGPVSGCHINPAVTVAAYIAGRLPAAEVPGYVAAQVLGAIVGAGILVAILSGRAGGYDVAGAGLGQNGFGPGYLGQYGVGAAFLTEVVATFLFVVVILGATSKAGATVAAGLAIGLTLVGIHLTFLQVTGVSVNPARSIGPAVFVGGKAMADLWLFIVAPVAGAAAAGLLFRAKVLEN